MSKRPHLLRELTEQVSSLRAVAKSNVSTMRAAAKILAPIARKVSEKTSINASFGTVWIYVKDREDLKTLLTLAQSWRKEAHYGDGVAYNATVDGMPFKLIAQDGALPPTCRMVEKLVTVPAQPERVEKRMVVECHAAPPVAVEAAPEPDIVTANA